MAGTRGGARPGAGRKKNAAKNPDKVLAFTELCTDSLPEAFHKLRDLIEGSTRTEVKKARAGTQLRRDVARDEDGVPIADDKGRLTVIQVPLFPEESPGNWLTIEEKVIRLPPEIRAIGELFDRAMGKARQAVELSPKDGQPLAQSVTIYIPDNARQSEATGPLHPASDDGPDDGEAEA